MSIRNVTRILALGLLAGVLLAGQAYASPIVSTSPSTQDATVGDIVSVDIMVSGLGATEEVGGFSLILSFNSAILTGLDFTNDPEIPNNMGAGALDFSGGFSPGSLDLFYSAEDFPGSTDEAVLQGLQGSGFTLSTVRFTAIGPGLSPLTLSVAAPGGTFLTDAVGANLPATSANGSVCVGAAGTAANCGGVAAVPEPGTIALIGTGVAALVLRRRRQVRSEA
jgi:hypothetical protein